MEEKEKRVIKRGADENGAGAVQNLVFNKISENLIEITFVFASLQAERERLNGIDSITWKQMFIDWSNEFETIHSDTDWDKNDYLEEIEKYAKRKILGYADILR